MTRKLIHPLRHRRQSGTSMIEVLMAVLILSVGLLAVAALQGVSLLNNHSAYLRTQAINFSYEFMDRIRASRSLILATGMPNATLTAWQSEMAAVLPGGSVAVTINQPAGQAATATIAVTWIDEIREERGASAEDPREVTFTTSSRI